jgi:hypothetical protein
MTRHIPLSLWLAVLALCLAAGQAIDRLAP